MEQICLLSNIGRKEVKLINIFFVGQNEVLDIMKDGKNEALRQKYTVHYTIEPLTESETQEYIKYRLKVAGSKTEIFNSEAIREIFSFSKGYPRLINIICDRALLTSFVSEANKIGEKIVKQCADDLKILVE
jgi:general secretion pathway protein A